MRRFIVLTIALAMVITLQAQKVSFTEAQAVATEWLSSYQSGLFLDSETVLFDSIQHESQAIIYRFSINPEGFVWVGADRQHASILAYSFESNLDQMEQNIPAVEFLDTYTKEFISSRETRTKSDAIHPDWIHPSYLNQTGLKTDESVEPMMEVTWGQGSGYNAHTPDHTPTGCVAVAMSQIMRFWSWPDTAHGLHEYTHGTYGDFAVNFDTVKFEWDQMPLNTPNDKIARLMFYNGIGLHMDYAPSGSGANTARCRTLLKDNFSYSGDRITYQGMSDYGSVKYWVNMLKNELRNGRPIIYRGQGTGGHAFNFDGFENDFFHVNWGWSGSQNGYFLVSSLTPGSNNFSEAQGCISGIFPDDRMMWDQPFDLMALALDAKVYLQWSAQYHRDLDLYRIYRDGVLLAETPDFSYTDETATNGTSFSYSVSGVYKTDSTSFESEQTQAIVVSPAEGFSLPFSEDFEEDHTGWQFNGGNRGFSWGTEVDNQMGTNEDNRFIGINSGIAGNNVLVSDYLVSNGFDFSESANLVFSCDYVLKRWQDIDHLYLMYRVFGDDEWTEIAEFEKTLNYQDWTQFKMYLPNEVLVANVQLALFYNDNGSTGYGAGIDNIRIEEVSNPGVPNFMCDKEVSCLGSAVVFTDASTGTRDSYFWDFGPGADPRTAATAGPHTVVYKSSGLKSVQLILNGLDETLKEDVLTVTRPPKAKFSKTINYKTVAFKNTSENATAYMWDFGDGSKVTQDEPSHTYALSGDYLVKLIAINHICENDTTESLVQIHITGLEENQFQTKISLYPNPVGETLYVDFENGLEHPAILEILNLNGQQIWKQELVIGTAHTRQEIDVSRQAPGIYFLRVSNSQDIQHIRFAIK